MTLADLRKLAVRRRMRVCFRIAQGLECVVTEHGVAKVPGLAGAPDFNLEEDLAGAREFRLDPGGSAADAGRPWLVSRDELAGMVEPAASAAATNQPGEE